MSKQSLHLHLDSFRDRPRPSRERDNNTFLSSRRPRGLGSRHSIYQQYAPDFRSASNTYRDNKRQIEPLVYPTSRYNNMKKPSIAYIQSQQDFISSLNGHIHNLKNDQRQQIQKQNTYMSHRSGLPSQFIVLESKYKKQKNDNALLAKEIQSRKKNIEKNYQLIHDLKNKLKNLEQQKQKVKYQYDSIKQQTRNIKEIIIKKQLSNRDEQNNRIQMRYSSSVSDLERERQQFEQRILYNKLRLYK